jgi:hypothetical protein
MIRIETGTRFVYSMSLPDLVEPGGGMFDEAKSHLKKFRKYLSNFFPLSLQKDQGTFFTL